jgi:hypothetical protein
MGHFYLLLPFCWWYSIRSSYSKTWRLKLSHHKSDIITGNAAETIPHRFVCIDRLIWIQFCQVQNFSYNQPLCLCSSHNLLFPQLSYSKSSINSTTPQRHSFNLTSHHIVPAMSAQVPGPKMSAATKDVISKVQRMIPPMLEKFHKGSLPKSNHCRQAVKLTR